jgi:sec-independent protein translocase protein TatA|tara:strand:- start:11160 stop:11411 length:252 start_codon:yes stop_codon:yes gene_type:complete
MTMLGGQELLIIFMIIMVLFGAKKLPELARSMGKAKKEFKDGMKDEEGNPIEEEPSKKEEEATKKEEEATKKEEEATKTKKGK